MATWRKKIEGALKQNGESWTDVVSSTFKEGQLDQEFDDGYGGSEGVPFTLWTWQYVYFPAVYDGAEWCASVPRHPVDEATQHIGG